MISRVRKIVFENYFREFRLTILVELYPRTTVTTVF